MDFSHIDNLLGNQEGGQSTEPQTDGAEPPTEPTTEPTGNVADEAEVQRLQDEIARLNADNVIKDQLIADKDAEIETLKAEVVAKEADNTELKAQLDVANQECEGHVKQNVALARLAHKIMCNRAIDIQIVMGDAKEEDREALMKDYATYTTQKLEDLTKELTAPAKIAERAKVEHPGASQLNDNSTQDESTSGSQTQEPTLDEYVDQVLQFFKSKM